MADNFKEYLVSFILIGLFIIAMISFSVGFANENNSTITIIGESKIKYTYTALNDTLSDLNKNTGSQENATSSDPGSFGAESIILTSIWGSLKVFWSSIKDVSNILATFMKYIGVSYLVIGVILSIIIITIIFLAWKTIRTGE